MAKDKKEKEDYEIAIAAFRFAKIVFGGAFVSMMIIVFVPAPFGQYIAALVYFAFGLYWFLTTE